jgi:ComF family protein
VKRGFNQSALLAHQLSRRTRIPVCWNALFRSTDTPPQAARSRKQRLDAMKHVFEGNPRATTAERRVLLIDDVVTTGATVEAAARALKKVGRAASVEVLCLARTSRY